MRELIEKKYKRRDNWPDHFSSGATRGSFDAKEDSIAERSAHPTKRTRMVMQDVRQGRFDRS